MAKLTVGEIAPVVGERFPDLCLTFEGRRYRLKTSHASRFGQALADAARRTVNRGHVDVGDRLLAVVCEIEIDPL